MMIDQHKMTVSGVPCRVLISTTPQGVCVCMDVQTPVGVVRVRGRMPQSMIRAAADQCRKEARSAGVSVFDVEEDDNGFGYDVDNGIGEVSGRKKRRRRRKRRRKWFRKRLKNVVTGKALLNMAKVANKVLKSKVVRGAMRIASIVPGYGQAVNAAYRVATRASSAVSSLARGRKGRRRLIGAALQQVAQRRGGSLGAGAAMAANLLRGGRRGARRQLGGAAASLLGGGNLSQILARRSGVQRAVSTAQNAAQGVMGGARRAQGAVANAARIASQLGRGNRGARLAVNALQQIAQRRGGRQMATARRVMQRSGILGNLAGLFGGGSTRTSGTQSGLEARVSQGMLNIIGATYLAEYGPTISRIMRQGASSSGHESTVVTGARSLWGGETGALVSEYEDELRGRTMGKGRPDDDELEGATMGVYDDAVSAAKKIAHRGYTPDAPLRDIYAMGLSTLGA